MADEVIKTCDECGAAVYPDHLESGRAGYVDDNLLCPICYRERQTSADEPDEADEPLALIDDAEMKAEATEQGPPKIKAFSDDSVLAQVGVYDESRFKRPPNYTGRGAVRCRTFHCKMSDAALAYLDSQINEWTDQHPEIEPKFATTTIGLFEGKQRQEPHLIVTVFY